MKKELLDTISDLIEVIEFAEERYNMKVCRCAIDYKCKFCRAKEVIRESKDHTKVRRKKVCCITTGKVFQSVAEAGRHYKIPSPNIFKVCGKINKSAGVFQGQRLKWEYI